GALLASFEGVEDRGEAAELQGAVLTIDKDERRSLTEGEFWPDDLEGLAALSHDGHKIGIVTGVVLGEAQDRLVITTTEGREFELPFVDELVGEVHPSGGFVVILPPEGLF
ncbi:MAG: 16S rRNA processing protein RimM, partial [Actinomycetia bacterium]|nr:16S rRNA processing protein RimM [Actinomycetes bacterium]